MKKAQLWKTLVLITALVAMIIVATFSWFITSTHSEFSQLDVNVGRATYIQVGNGDNWSNDLDVNLQLPDNYFDGFREISGNGTLLFKPKTQDSYVRGEYVRNITGFEAVSDSKGYYYVQDLTFRSDRPQEVYLDPSSFVDALGGSYIDGAVRIAFFEVNPNGRETLCYIWAPNSTQGEGVEEYYFYQKSTNFVDLSMIDFNEEVDALKKDIAIIPTGGALCGYNAEYKYLWTYRSEGGEGGESDAMQVFPENPPAVFSFTENDEKDTDDSGITFFKKQIRVRLWLEGYDRECNTAISGQKFKVKLKFSIDVEEKNNNE